MIASDFVVVDSSGWIEYLGDGPKAAAFARYLDDPEHVLLPATVVYEVYRQLLRKCGSHMAEGFLAAALGFGDRLISLDIPIAELAARVSLEKNLSMSEAIIYASARQRRASLVTLDSHFDGLPYVTIL
jgi:predicted nucleic acid-binding protein